MLSLWYCQKTTNNPSLAVVPASFPPKIDTDWSCRISREMFHKGPTCSFCHFRSTVRSVYLLKRITLIALMPQCLKQPPHVQGDIETRLLSQQRRKIDYTIASQVNAGYCFCRTARLACLVPARPAVFLKHIFFSFQRFAHDISKYFNQI